MRTAVRPRLTLATIWLALPVFLAAGQGELHQIAVSDFWWHLRYGQLIVETGGLPSYDQFSYTMAGAFYPLFQWLGEVYLYLTYRLGGLELVILANALLMAAVAWLMVLAALQAGAGQRVSGVLVALFVFICVSPATDTRPQLIGYLLGALWVLELTRWRAGRPARLWLFPLTTILWVNSNGTVSLGLGLLAVTWLGHLLQYRLRGKLGQPVGADSLRRLGLAALACLPALLVNPYGLGVARYFADYTRDPGMFRMISEWQAPAADNLAGALFLGLLAVSLLVAALAPRRLELAEALTLLAFAALALTSWRGIPWFGLVAAPIVARQARSLADLLPMGQQTGESALLNWTLAGTLVVVALLLLPWWRAGLPLPAEQRGLVAPDTPRAAVEYAASRYPGERFYHPYATGSYMVWEARDRLQVFVDGRYDLYAQAGVMKDYRQIVRAEDWEDVLARYGIRHVVVSLDSVEANSMKPLLEELRRSPIWKQVYEDEHALIFAREAD
ncbi:MAG: hypothetical protein M1401_14935 [Chloroflexi bacterium]|nr:hypothetical protein [Chloroflexota bacterium]